MRWSDSTLPNNSNVSTKFRLLRMLLKRHVIRSSADLSRKKCSAVLRGNSKIISATNFTIRRVKKLPSLSNELR